MRIARSLINHHQSGGVFGLGCRRTPWFATVQRRGASGLGLLLAVALGLLAAPASRAGEVALELGDFAWTTGALRTEVSVMREIPECQGVTGGTDVAFKSEEGPLSVIPVTLKAKKSGRLVLVPELFLVRDGGLYGVYLLCQGFRMVNPPPAPDAAAFHPPADGRQWPGHAGWISVATGQEVVIELLFGPIVGKEAEVLAASSVARVRPGDPGGSAPR